jgi:hypothetical protein
MPAPLTIEELTRRAVELLREGYEDPLEGELDADQWKSHLADQVRHIEHYVRVRGAKIQSNRRPD